MAGEFVKPYRQGEIRAFEFVTKRIQMNEPCAVVSMSGLGKRMLFSSIQNFAETNLKNFLVKPYNATSPTELEDILLEVSSISEPVLLILKLSFNGDCNSFFEKLNSLRVKKYRSFLPVVLANTSNIYSAYEDKNKIISNSFYVMKPNDRQDIDEVINDYEGRYGIKISSELRNEFAELSGGHTGFLKGLYLEYCDNPESKFDKSELAEKESFLCWIEDLASDLPTEKIVALADKYRDEDDEKLLEKFGYLDNKKVFSPIFEAHLDRIFNSSRKGNFENTLSAQETDLFNLFKNGIGELISRDDIAKVLWKDEWVDKYSDWSIDQAVYRIRKKIKEAKQPYKIITRKGLGLVME